jgi:hypothetical protein
MPASARSMGFIKNQSKLFTCARIALLRGDFQLLLCKKPKVAKNPKHRHLFAILLIKSRKNQ